MARSIHTTHRSVRRLARMEFSDPDAKAKLLGEAEDELERKRLIKHLTRRERDQIRPIGAGNAADVVPVEFLDCGQFVHHCVTEAEVRALLTLLPPEALEGLSVIQFRLGKEYLVERELAGKGTGSCVDPFTGRISNVVLPRVYGPTFLGVYSPSTASIRMHAYVYNPDELPLSIEAVDAFLKLRVFATLLHEVAHHHDEMVRVRRGRWLADREATVERYAERMEQDWLHRLAIPLIESSNGGGLRLFLDWFEEHCGIRTTLGALCGDCIYYRRKPIFGPDLYSSLRCWAEDVDLSAPLWKQRLDFAQEVHWSDEYELCLQILDRVLAKVPTDEKTLTLRADTLWHLRRNDEALALAESLLARDQTNYDAWWVKVAVAEDRHQPVAMLEAARGWVAIALKAGGDLRSVSICEAVALSALGRLAEAEAAIEVICRRDQEFRPLSGAALVKRQTVLRRVIGRRVAALQSAVISREDDERNLLKRAVRTPGEG